MELVLTGSQVAPGDSLLPYLVPCRPFLRWVGLTYVTNKTLKKWRSVTSGRKRHYGFHLLSLRSLARWGAVTTCEDTQAAWWRMHVVRPWRIDWTATWADNLPAPGKPSDDCSLGRHLDNNLMGDPEPEALTSAAPELLASKNWDPKMLIAAFRCQVLRWLLWQPQLIQSCIEWHKIRLTLKKLNICYQLAYLLHIDPSESSYETQSFT